jgi:uncharacterized protein (TIGR04222 family)
VNVFDWTGPAFLATYLIALAVCFVLWWWLRYVGADREVADSDLGSLHAYELAFLGGGADAAIRAAITSLVQRGRVACDADGLRLTGAPADCEVVADGVFRGIVRERTSHPLDEAIVARLRTDEPTPYASLAGWDDAAARRLEARLVARGYLAGASAANRRSRLAKLPLMLLLLTGMGKILVGIARDRPVGFLVLLVLVTIVLLWRLPSTPRLTRSGERLLVLAGRQYAALRATAGSAPQQLSGDEVALACGLFGGAVLGGALSTLAAMYVQHDAEVALAAAAQARMNHSNGGSDAGCGSGASCGSGCGGCGGCG